MSIENPSATTAETKNERPYWLSESGLENPLINGVLKEGVTEEKALEVQREWKEKGHQWEERHRVYWEAFSHRPSKWGEKNEFEEVEAEAKKIADDYYKVEYVPAYHRYTDLWTVPGRTENTNTPQEKSSSVDDLRKSLYRFKN